MVSQKKKPLTDAEVEVCARLKQVWDEKTKDLGVTQEVAAAELGVSQGAISHFLSARNAVHTDAVIYFATLLQVPIERINPELSSRIFSTPLPMLGNQKLAAINRLIAAAEELKLTLFDKQH
jgi:transcriptional regulator with XRE-family HTH domain